MIITTAGRTNEQMVQIAKNIAQMLNIEYVPRNKKSIMFMQNTFQNNVLVAGKERLEYYKLGESEPFFFHPNSAMFRVKRIKKGEKDTFIEATNLSYGQSLLDCTLGLASDSITASFVVGDLGQVVGIEESKVISFLVQTGLKMWETDFHELNQAMRRISVNHCDHLTFLKNQPDNSFDVVYFDPMFDEEIMTSNGINTIRPIASYQPITNETVQEAKRVANKRVVLKDHYKSRRFEQFNFHVLRRKTAKFHYGVIKL